MKPNLPLVCVGTSSWTYEGWQELVYHRSRPKSRFSQNTLAEYAAYAAEKRPYFPSSASIIRSTDQPAPNSRHIAPSKCPSTFAFYSKAWEEITIPVYANLPRYGAKAGENPSSDS